MEEKGGIKACSVRGSTDLQNDSWEEGRHTMLPVTNKEGVLLSHVLEVCLRLRALWEVLLGLTGLPHHRVQVVESSK